MERSVVVTGMGVRSSIGTGLPAFWDALRAGRSGVRRIRTFDPSDLAIQVAGEVDLADEEHPLPVSERRWVSKAVPLLLLACREALGQSGLQAETLDLETRRRFGVFVGSGGGAQDFVERNYEQFFAGRVKDVTVYAIPSATMGSLASEVSMDAGLHGPALVLSTGCTSSTDALGQALLHIRHGRCDLALAGGVDTPITRGVLTGFARMKVCTRAWNHAPEQASRPFHADRDGFVLGEGAWMFLLEAEEHAVARNAPILARVAGYAATCDAHHRVRLAEDGVEPARAMTLALEEAGVAPADLGHVQLHGTATVLNDRIETRAVRLALGAAADAIPMSSVKSFIGHPQGAAGAAGVAAALLALCEGFVPPTLNLDRPDPECDLDYTPLRGREARVNAVLCNCIGFGSKNAALVLTR